MARIRKIRKEDGDALFSLYGDHVYRDENGELPELFVVPGGRRAYFTVHSNKQCVAFSGRKTLRKLAHAILRVTN